MAQRYAKVREQDIVRRREDYAANVERERATAQRWYEGNKERASQTKKVWVSQNRGKVNAWNKTRKVRKIQAMPPWADVARIEAVYQEAEEFKALGLDVHVDHIVPLQGKNVCGLHVHDNLQILLAADNISKGNRFTVSVS